MTVVVAFSFILELRAVKRAYCCRCSVNVGGGSTVAVAKIF